MDILFWITLVEKIHSGEHLYVIEEIDSENPEYRLIVTETFTDELILMEILSKKDKGMFLYLLEHYEDSKRQEKIWNAFWKDHKIETR